jgi:hypothetical protein
MNEWNIQSRAHACQACQKPFVDKDHFHTVLLEGRHELVRQDICVACWNEKYAQHHAERKGFISHWQGIYQAPVSSNAPEPIQKETAETLLRHLIDANDPKHGPACYILAVMLERKRLLKIKEQVKRDGLRVFVYEHPKTGDLFTITDPNLQLNQLEAVQRDVADLLVNGYNPPAPAPTPAVPVDDVAPETGDVAEEATAPVDTTVAPDELESEPEPEAASGEIESVPEGESESVSESITPVESVEVLSDEPPTPSEEVPLPPPPGNDVAATSAALPAESSPKTNDPLTHE